MGLIIGGVSAHDLVLDGQSVSLYVGGSPPVKVWPDRETVQITLDNLMQARDQFRDALSARGLSYTTVTEIPFDIELVGSGSARNMFYGCAALTHVPDIDTSGVTDMVRMFQDCSSLTTVPGMNTSNVTIMNTMFRGCSSLTSVPDLDTSGVTDMVRMFENCSSLTTVPGMNTSNVTIMNTMFYGCAALTHVPDLDTSSVTNMGFMFYDCSSLTHVPDMDTSQVTTMNNMFRGCSSLTHAPDLDTSGVTNMAYMFWDCAALTHVPDLDTAQVTSMNYMFENCSSLTDGNVRLIGRHPQVTTTSMITGSGLTREPFYDTAGQPWPTSEVHEVSLTEVVGMNVAHALTTLTIPEGQTWQVRVQGQITEASGVAAYQPFFRIGAVDGAKRGVGAVDVSGTVTPTAPSVALVTIATGSPTKASFTGTVTITKP